MKKIALVLIVLIAAWAGATIYTGTQLETKTADLVKRINEEWAKTPLPEGTLEIKQISYERGLFSSHARFGLQLHLSHPMSLSYRGPEIEELPMFEYDTKISHGPFPLGALRHGHLLPRRYQAAGTVQWAGFLRMISGAFTNGKPMLTLDFGCSYGHHCSGTGITPPINIDLRPFSPIGEMTFGGTETEFDFKRTSDTEYTQNSTTELLPWVIGGQNFGGGQFIMNGDAKSSTNTLAWKTDQGAGKVTLALTLNKPLPMWDISVKPEDLPGLLQTVSLKVDVSKAMIVDLAARAMILGQNSGMLGAPSQGMDVETVRTMIGGQLEIMLAAAGSEFINIQGDQLTSEWLYADGKLTINGKEQPEILDQIKRSSRQFELDPYSEDEYSDEEEDDSAAPVEAPVQTR
jgi:uncharacterized protein YdgA (DUF945 family)